MTAQTKKIVAMAEKIVAMAGKANRGARRHRLRHPGAGAGLWRSSGEGGRITASTSCAIMTEDVPPEAADPTALTGALRDAGVLTDGLVAEATVLGDYPTIVSRIVRLRLTYDDAPADAPGTIILKTGLPRTMSKDWNGGRQEVEFYTRIAPMLPDGVVPRCFQAHWSPDTGAWHLLLEDLTDTHAVATHWPLPPTRADCETILTAHARLHAAWWNDPRLGVTVGNWLVIEDYQQRVERDYAAMADRLGENLSLGRRNLYRRFLDAIPRLYARYQTHRDMTIVQGDSHIWNCFLPRNGGIGVRLFDWDSWRIHLSAVDLAYMMAMHWYPDRRQQMERTLLDHYHNVLVTNGVTLYSRRALEDDYRWAVLTRLALPPMLAGARIPPVIWWNHLERILMAVDDLGARALLG
jgi:hypothetical protein